MQKIPDTDKQNPVICLSGNKNIGWNGPKKKQPSALSPLKEPEGPRLRFSSPCRAFSYIFQPAPRNFDNSW